MGADLYISKIYDANMKIVRPLFEAAVKRRDALPAGPEQDKAQEEVSKHYEDMHSVGYFRDSYNGSSLFWKLGLSWWGMCRDAKDKGAKDKTPRLISSRGTISVENAKKLRTLVASLPITITDEDLQGWGDNPTKDDLRKYFEDKRKRFLEFLDTAIKNKMVIRASV